MPVINIYLSKELFELVKNDKSKIIQEALREYREKRQQHRQQMSPHLAPDVRSGTLTERKEESG
jgi:gas vesicle protein